MHNRRLKWKIDTRIKAFPKVDKREKEEGTLYNKAYATAMEARKAADDEDRQNLKEIRAVEATKGMKMGGDAHASSCGCDSCMGESSARGAGSAIRGTGFKGVF
jgi:hypothetical protein